MGNSEWVLGRSFLRNSELYPPKKEIKIENEQQSLKNIGEPPIFFNLDIFFREAKESRPKKDPLFDFFFEKSEKKLLLFIFGSIATFFAKSIFFCGLEKNWLAKNI